MSAAALLLIAKAPVPGRVKTRLMPPCTADQAAALAAAALADTVAAMAAVGGPRRRVVVLDGEPDGWIPEAFEVVAQRGGGLAERLAGAFEDVGGPALLIGMDTPQVTGPLLEAGLLALDAGADAVLGLAPDGGYWAIGLREPDARVFAGVPMSEPATGAVQQSRLETLGLSPARLPALRDVDTIEDARTVAATTPGSRFAAALAELEPAA